ncbi:hypothetical protein Tfont_02495 [Tepidimonas fonticaldi]|uniref:Uncharacterized protein n=1 Tax=Tepidimonas fonticaldi TaxID=1101373 RepID=A0A554XGH0_9BURK|nr:hypothetical protein Tfont_02495 [Tepidimonas fonticaldi]
MAGGAGPGGGTGGHPGDQGGAHRLLHGHVDGRDPGARHEEGVAPDHVAHGQIDRDPLARQKPRRQPREVVAGDQADRLPFGAGGAQDDDLLARLLPPVGGEVVGKALEGGVDALDHRQVGKGQFHPVEQPGRGLGGHQKARQHDQRRRQQQAQPGDVEVSDQRPQQRQRQLLGPYHQRVQQVQRDAGGQHGQQAAQKVLGQAFHGAGVAGAGVNCATARAGPARPGTAPPWAAR